MEHPEIESKLTVVPFETGAQVTLTNGFQTTPMTLKELEYSAQILCEAVDKVKRLQRQSHAIRRG